MPRKVKTPVRVWVTRDRGLTALTRQDPAALYNISSQKPSESDLGSRGLWETMNAAVVCPAPFEAVTGIHMEPGAGPLRYEIPTEPWRLITRGKKPPG